MLIPTGMNEKERKKYVRQHTHQLDPNKINVGPKAGLRPPGKVRIAIKGKEKQK